MSKPTPEALAATRREQPSAKAQGLATELARFFTETGQDYTDSDVWAVAKDIDEVIDMKVNAAVQAERDAIVDLINFGDDHRWQRVLNWGQMDRISQADREACIDAYACDLIDTIRARAATKPTNEGGAT